MASRAESWLLWILRCNALLMFSALAAVFIPYAWMNDIHQWLGLGVLPHTPLMGYLTRSISFLYAIIGMATWVLASNASRYWPLIGWWGWACVASAVVMALIDIVEGMPLYWLLLESIYLLLLGAAVLWLRSRARRPILQKDMP